ncbi:MAG: hypothetical protein ALECFALPRED_001310 [Alectoria fallacina]|uniref:Uncharacterized protein n=1 Tax=Alectoria fallacina TaxID=1903189 RepID=A0A8H3FA37_9LECA|nr:MAG: hypothetical protein ALECFALPRED_001310 [Alectoria fallacina]
MTESQPDPISRPNSALAGPPHLAQLRFVNARLEKNPHPREDYSRQFSPDRQTPESQRTPFIPWPDIDPIEDLKEAKAWAAEEAKRLEQFYAGRVLLRKEEPEKYGIFGEDPEYWDSQTSHWKFEYEKLAEEYDRRKQLEAQGNANEEYAEALLLSPIQSSSSSPSDGISRATAAGIDKHKPAAIRPSRQTFTKSPSQHLKKRSPIHRSQYSSMSDSDYEPVSRPKSTINGFPSFCQVQLVNKALEKNPHPRKDFYRQFSITPERQTPESQRTPQWSISDPAEYREAADCAEEARDSLKRFYAGRVLLRKDPDRFMACGCNAAYWRSKAKEWLDEIQNLQEEYETRIEQEQRGEAEKGYAQAVLSSPLQSPSRSPSDDTLRVAAPNIKRQKPVFVRHPQQPIGKSRSQSRKKLPHPQQPTPNHSSDSISKVTKGRQRSRDGLGRGEKDESSLNQKRLRKRQRRETTDPPPTHQSDPVTKTGRGPRKRNWNISKASTEGTSKRKKLPSSTFQAPRVLPWDLRSRNVTLKMQYPNKNGA